MTRVLLAATLVISVSFALQAAEEAAARKLGGDTLLVEIDGVKITMAEFEKLRPAGLFQASNNYYEAERKAVDEFVSDYLLAREAKKERISVPELIERHINSGGFKQPSEETLRVYFEGVDTTEPYEAVRDRIIEAIRTRRLAKAKTAYLAQLKKQANVVFRSEPPRAPISLKDTPIRGSATAPVVVVEYADYECPYCQQIQPVLDKLLTDYQGKVSFAFKDFPLPMHTNAQKAAEAAHCADAQGKYWQFHDHLFSTRQFEPSKLKGSAQALKLDAKAFNLCLDSGQQAAKVKTHAEEAQALGLPGTPAFFVNGRPINPNGTVSYETLSRLIDDELALSQRAKDSGSATGGTPRQEK